MRLPRPVLLVLSASACLLAVNPTLGAEAPGPRPKPPAPSEIVQLEQRLWTTIAEGDFDRTRRLFASDFIQVDGHIQALDGLLIPLRHCRLTTYELKDLQVRILSPDSAMTAYHVTNTFECDQPGAPLSRSFDNDSVTVWVRQPDTQQWLVQAHTETPAQP